MVDLKMKNAIESMKINSIEIEIQTKFLPPTPLHFPNPLPNNTLPLSTGLDPDLGLAKIVVVGRIVRPQESVP